MRHHILYVCETCRVQRQWANATVKVRTSISCISTYLLFYKVYPLPEIDPTVQHLSSLVSPPNCGYFKMSCAWWLVSSRDQFGPTSSKSFVG